MPIFLILFLYFFSLSIIPGDRAIKINFDIITREPKNMRTEYNTLEWEGYPDQGYPDQPDHLLDLNTDLLINHKDLINPKISSTMTTSIKSKIISTIIKKIKSQEIVSAIQEIVSKSDTNNTFKRSRWYTCIKTLLEESYNIEPDNSIKYDPLWDVKIIVYNKEISTINAEYFSQKIFDYLSVMPPECSGMPMYIMITLPRGHCTTWEKQYGEQFTKKKKSLEQTSLRYTYLSYFASAVLLLEIIGTLIALKTRDRTTVKSYKRFLRQTAFITFILGIYCDNQPWSEAQRPCQLQKILYPFSCATFLLAMFPTKINPFSINILIGRITLLKSINFTR